MVNSRINIAAIWDKTENMQLIDFYGNDTVKALFKDLEYIERKPTALWNKKNYIHIRGIIGYLSRDTTVEINALTTFIEDNHR